MVGGCGDRIPPVKFLLTSTVYGIFTMSLEIKCCVSEEWAVFKSITLIIIISRDRTDTQNRIR
jgi:hypothetical protein